MVDWTVVSPLDSTGTVGGAGELLIGIADEETAALEVEPVCTAEVMVEKWYEVLVTVVVESGVEPMPEVPLVMVEVTVSGQMVVETGTIEVTTETSEVLLLTGQLVAVAPQPQTVTSLVL
jgi:hypothetical protein